MFVFRRVKKHVRGILILILLICVFRILIRQVRVEWQQGSVRKEPKITYPNVHFHTKPVKRVLKWTPVFLQDSLDGDKLCLSTCSAKCEITNDKNDIENVDAIDFHLSNLWPEIWSIGTKSLVELPKYRKPEQVWILGNLEPPAHLWGNIKILNGLFNWTKWYRYDADVFWPYGVPHKYNAQEAADVSAKLPTRNYYKEKSREVIVRIGNCFDNGQRYKIIERLGKYIHIDKFGKCYNKQCGNSTSPNDKLCEEIVKHYKFYLAFENDICRDYVTEKYWYTLEANVIPIVNWKFINMDNVIPNSYINIYDFNSTENLAKYLKEVSVNETLYNSYFEYKKSYTNRPKTCVTCTLCHALHNSSKPAQVYTDIEGWIEDDPCQKVTLWSNFVKRFSHWIFTVFGV